jgi:hypothetical protein
LSANAETQRRWKIEGLKGGKFTRFYVNAWDHADAKRLAKTKFKLERVDTVALSEPRPKGRFI